MFVGKSVQRVDAYDKVTGRARFTDDLCDKGNKIICFLICVGSGLPAGSFLCWDPLFRQRTDAPPCMPFSLLYASYCSLHFR